MNQNVAPPQTQQVYAPTPTQPAYAPPSTQQAYAPTSTQQAYAPAPTAPTTYAPTAPTATSTHDVLLYFIAIFIPPLAVYFKRQFHGAFWVNIGLSMLGWIPGVIHAWYIISKY